jgi:pyridoxamine 5'-phosphate oxidase
MSTLNHGLSTELDIRLMKDDPLVEFQVYWQQAQNLGLQYPNVMSLATCDEHGTPDVRSVLLKGLNEKSLEFFTNYSSTKAMQIMQNPHVALLFYWEPLGIQVRFRGKVEKVSCAVSDAYFSTRPRLSQIGAWASQQSQPLESRAQLEDSVRDLEQRFAGAEIPRPDHWGGFAVFPSYVEFWREHPGRLHDRIAYFHHGNQWTRKRLYP